MRRTIRHGGAVAALLALAAGCGKGTAPTEPAAPPAQPWQIEAVYPAARSTFNDYGTDIWVRFVEPLDPATVHERSVFLKLDTVRIPLALGYEAAARTIRLRPLARLELLRTYTVVITTAVHTSAGTPLAQEYFWQFKTNSLRHPTDPVPAAFTADESRFAVLRWARTEPGAGTVVYEVSFGDDSTAVAARLGGPSRTVAVPWLIPSPSWGLGRRVYWAVTAVNRTTDERIAGPVWRFDTLSPGLPVDSVVVSADHWGWIHVGQNRTSCTSLSTGPSYNNGIHWRLREQASHLKLAGARLVITTTNVGNLAGIRPSIRPVFEPWVPCVFAFNSPSVVFLDLALGAQIGGTQQFALASDAFTSYLEAAARHGVVYGFSIGSAVDASWAAGPPVTLYYYRLPPAPAPARQP